ncbi:MAG: PEGA domain-containing protein, partial [Bacteroidales bacterium]|nr:PEGA domain-containing protein [Bacteroidales bacterium]
SKEGVKLLTESGEEVMDVELDPSFGYITVNSVPAGADVYIDEQKLGITPYNLKKISLGSHAVELRKYGYVSTGEIVIIKAGENNKQLANVTLERDKNIILQQAGQQTKTTK